MNVPRLTGALRAFSNISSHLDLSEDTYDLSEKRRLRRKRGATNCLTWTLLKNTLVQHAKTNDINSSLKELMQAAKDTIGCEVSMQTVEEACILFFNIFKDSSSVRHYESKRLKHLFGPFPASAATKACNIVNQIISTLPEEVLSNLQAKSSGTEIENEEFGCGIKFSHLKQPVEYDNLSDSDLDAEDSESSKLDFKFHGSVKKNENVNNENEEQSQVNETAWLRNQVEQYFNSGGNSLALSINDIYTSLFDMLLSNKSDNELQNDFFELLGFDSFDLIKILLERRLHFISVILNDQCDERSHLNLPNKVKDSNFKPVYGCQVTIQSEQEKQLNKLYRKEEKKLARRDRKDEETDPKEKFNPQDMRVKREMALTIAKNTPLFSNHSVSLAPRENYPHVYDLYAEARQSSAFIAGTKMVLPQGFERLNTSIYEEINIPSTQSITNDVGKEPISISSLDKIGQLAFQGIKHLNRIQSIVYDTAYHTNENLLICAPTGAGKTNIAMLAILHEIKQNMEHDIIYKDKFKIVYVAPMKALAAEMTRNFSKRLEPLNIVVRELTGDMSLTKNEILQTQILVTTPEKWDVVTRKSTGDVSLSQLVRLLIIDEVHLLHDDRGPVIETLVARTLRQVETSQSMIRIVGLSATLPNYLDVAQFLRVSPYKGLFFFDGRFRPVPLGQTYIGIKAGSTLQQMQDMDSVCYDKIVEQVKRGYQVMVFVHARNATVRTAMVFQEMASNKGDSKLFRSDQDQEYGAALKQVLKSRNKQVRDLFADGFSIHHAGMLRSDRNLVEKLFSNGTIKVLVCTATLAWGVNLPAHAVIIKGTQIYDARRGTFVDLGILDVMQIFGRAGRPQFDTYGHGTIITSHDKLSHYLSLMTRQHPIESQFISCLEDNLNAEISLGTVTNVEEAVEWLSYTYLFVRMRRNPHIYGINYKEVQDDPDLLEHRRKLISKVSESLDTVRMIRFDLRTEDLSSTDLGRIASHFYIKYDTVEVFNELFKPLMTEADVLAMVSKSQEFQQIKVRDDELDELDELMDSYCLLPVAGGSENAYGKVNILLQNYISRGSINSFSLISDSAYIIQNSTRIIRALFEIALRKGHPIMAGRLLTLSKVAERRLWSFDNPLKQFDILSFEILKKIEEKKLTIEKIKEMDSKDIGLLLHHVKMGKIVKQCAYQIPLLDIEATIQPITRTVLRVRLSIIPDFSWNDKVHGKSSEAFWIWVEDPETNHMYHHEFFVIQKRQVILKESQILVFTIPIFEPLPSQYYVRIISDRWLGSETTSPISFKHLILPERHPPHTELLDLDPLPITALDNPDYESLYRFTHFNPIQTQIFFCLYHTDSNVLLGAPTGSGKTVAAELAFFRIFKLYPKTKAVYIAPLKALVRERIEDWKIRLQVKLKKKVVELTGDVTPDINVITNADIIVTTPEKWDGISRSWQTRNYVKTVSLIVIDEIHLLGEDRGPVLEVIVSRTNFISSHTSRSVRIIGLSTALANARDLADWLNIKQMGLYNFKPSVRPVPLEVHISGFPGKHYCPRMATMNKPAFQAIRKYSPEKPVLIFVSSRRQTRLTALDLIAYLAAENQPKMWLHISEEGIDDIIYDIRDNNLKLTLAFGIGIHHAGLHEKDRRTVELLFVNHKIQVLIATATLAWGVNFPAHLVILKGTEYYDGKTKRYLDYPITDVLQMMGRAGRPQFDEQGVAVILVHDLKKHFYKKFLYEPFPVESSLLDVLPDHLNAEIVSGTITSKQDAMDYITWTYFFRRVIMNPSYYKLEDTSHDSINIFLSTLIEKSVITLEVSFCLEVGPDNRTLIPLTLGRIASFYYLSHKTVKMFHDKLKSDSSINDLLEILSEAHEYSEVPIRHNEDAMNEELAKQLPIEVKPYSFDCSHTKVHLLFQAHFCRLALPCSDYQTDRKSILDQAIRILQAMIDVVADQGWLVATLRVMQLFQMVIQAQWIDESSLLMLPHITSSLLHCFRLPDRFNGKKTTTRNIILIESIPELINCCQGHYKTLAAILETEIDHSQIEEIYQVLEQLPLLQVSINIKGIWDDQNIDHQQMKSVSVTPKSGILADCDWIRLHADQEYILSVDLIKMNKMKTESKAYSPHFPKPKDESWWLVFGEVDSQELLVLKRIGNIYQKSTVLLSFYTPEKEGRVIYTLYIMSDSYVGLDQQYDVHLEIIPASLKAQVNMEVI